MNKAMMMAGLEHYSRPQLDLDPKTSAFIYSHPPTETGTDRGRVFQEFVMWHQVAAAALAHISALEQAQWFTALPDDSKFQQLMRWAQESDEARRTAHTLRLLLEQQVETIRTLQGELALAQQAIRV